MPTILKSGIHGALNVQYKLHNGMIQPVINLPSNIVARWLFFIKLSSATIHKLFVEFGTAIETTRNCHCEATHQYRTLLFLLNRSSNEK